LRLVGVRRHAPLSGGFLVWNEPLMKNAPVKIFAAD
jgi:hypothetical protein